MHKMKGGSCRAVHARIRGACIFLVAMHAEQIIFLRFHRHEARAEMDAKQCTVVFGNSKSGIFMHNMKGL